MSNNVIKMYPHGSGKNPDAVLEQAVGVYKDVLIVGLNKDNELEVRATTSLTYADLVWLVDKFKFKLLNGDYDPEDEQ